MSQNTQCTDFDKPLVQPQVLSGHRLIRWTEGERLNHLLEQACLRFGSREAVVGDEGTVSYRDLDDRANRLARHLVDQRVGPGDRVGLLLERSVETYVALLAVLKTNAAYVPLDPASPVERIRFILANAGISTVVSTTAFRPRLDVLDVRRVLLDEAAKDIDTRPCTPLTCAQVAPPVDRVCYIIYTSGTTGTPKGVVIEHPSICNFVRVAAELYGFAPGDRVYQGMTIAFDFSLEEIWVPLIAGATLVPGPAGVTMLGEELADFLRARGVTCMACCPTLLATIETDVPTLRILLVGGEACPHGLIVRWHRPGRTILNSYGPTEATVTASLTELTLDKPVTIGTPLPTYSIVILDPVTDQIVPCGELGEIGIAGIGLAAGYLNRDDLTRQKFIVDFLDIPNNPSKRIYRTGDLGRITEESEVEYHGRIDTQVKIRGYRIELTEIEAVLLDLPGITQAAVTTYDPEPGQTELVAYYALKQGAPGPSPGEVAKVLRGRLPAYMVPAFLEELPVIPMTISNKADHRQLPKPAGSRLPDSRVPVAPRTESERVLVRTLGEVLKVGQVCVEDHFFDDLGANSLVMARFCARLRQQASMSVVSMRDIYLHPTVARLAEHLRQSAPEEVAAAVPEPFHVPSDLAYYGCGALQLLSYAAYGFIGLWALVLGFEWIAAAAKDPVVLYLRSVVLAVGFCLSATAFAILAKWVLIGRWTVESFPIWSLRYYRFWVVSSLVRSAPIVLFAGSPIYSVYLRLLGAKIGRNVTIQCQSIPACTDLISIGDNTILRKDTIVLGYRAQSNFIHTGPVTIGRNAFVGEASVLDIDTAIGDDGQLGHASSLQSGQRIPRGKRFHGSPAVETTADYCPIDNTPCSTLRRGLYEAAQLLVSFAVVIPVLILALVYAGDYAFANGADASIARLLVASAVLVIGALAAALFTVVVVPRLCRPLLVPDRTYSLYGLHHQIQKVVSGYSNSDMLNLLFGDSSAIVRYMRLIGWNLNKVEQTGSNFGTNQKHDNPFLCDIGSGTMVSDGLSMINMHKSASSFRLSRTRIGDHNYLGNDIHYPPDGRTGSNCLLGTKVMIPIEGPVRENVGLLGSPCFEIPRIVDRDKTLIGALSDEERRQRIKLKNIHNLVTVLLFLSSQWLLMFTVGVICQIALLAYPQYSILAPFAAMVTASGAAILFYVVLERASLGFRRLEPTIATIYDSYFWSHERYWKLAESPISRLFAGTPFKNLISRLIGVKMGRKVYDGGCIITEKTLTEIGDHGNLNAGSVLQAHSLEEGVFKSDHIRLGRGCTLGPAAFVHYGVTMGDHAVLDADSFLMKGETLDAHSVWRGNPARLHRRGALADPRAPREPSRTAADCFVPRITAE